MPTITIYQEQSWPLCMCSFSRACSAIWKLRRRFPLMKVTRTGEEIIWVISIIQRLTRCEASILLFCLLISNSIIESNNWHLIYRIKKKCFMWCFLFKYLKCLNNNVHMWCNISSHLEFVIVKDINSQDELFTVSL